MRPESYLITGAAGALGSALQHVVRERGDVVIPLDRQQLDVTDESAVRAVLTRMKPDVVLQCAAYTRVDDAENEEALAFKINADGAACVARACADIGARFVYPSTDYVFDGNATFPYKPDAKPDPINAYGRSKVVGERLVRETGNALVIRTSWLYGRAGRNFVRTAATKLSARQPMRVVDDQYGSPTWTFDLARAIVAMLNASAEPGIYHLANAGVTSWYGLALEVAGLLGTPELVTPCSTAEFPTPARRPAYSALDCSASQLLIGPMRPWQHALREAWSARAF